MEKEIWKDIPDYEGLYKVSNLGRVKSSERKLTRNDGVLQLIREKILRQSNWSGKYNHVVIYKDKKKKTKYTHQLVAMAFLNHDPKKTKLVVDHIDNDKTNNSINNLQLITRRENNSKDKQSKTGFTGVTYKSKRGKYSSIIKIKGKSKFLGYYKTAEAASEAYQRELSKIMELQ